MTTLPQTEVRSNFSLNSLNVTLVGGSGSVSEQFGVFTPNAWNTMALRLKDNDVAAYINGSQAVTDSSVTFNWSALDRVGIGTGYNDGFQSQVYFSQVYVEPNALSNAELAERSSIG